MFEKICPFMDACFAVAQLILYAFLSPSAEPLNPEFKPQLWQNNPS